MSYVNKATFVAPCFISLSIPNRYCRDPNAKPLWPKASGRPNGDDIPPCRHCGGPLRFEVQVVKHCHFSLPITLDGSEYNFFIPRLALLWLMLVSFDGLRFCLSCYITCELAITWTRLIGQRLQCTRAKPRATLI